MVLFPFIGDSVGGSHKSAILLIQFLKKRGLPCEILLHTVSGALPQFIRDHGLEFSHLALPPASYRTIDVFMALFSAIPRIVSRYGRKSELIVHTNDIRTHRMWAVASRFIGAKHIWHSRQILLHSAADRLLFYRFSKRFICISDFVLKSAPTDVKDRVISISNPFETEQRFNRESARGQIVEALSLESDVIILSYVGNLIPRKRAEICILVLQQLRTMVSRPLALLIFGDNRDNLADRLLEVAQSHAVDDSLHLMGFRSPIEPYLAGCDIMLAPAIDEPFGRVLVEAMIVGTPVVAADSGGHREILEDGVSGFLLPPDDIEGYAKRCLALIDSVELSNSITARARQAAIDNYSLDRHGERMLEVYRTL